MPRSLLPSFCSVTDMNKGSGSDTKRFICLLNIHWAAQPFEMLLTCNFCLVAFTGTEATSSGCLRSKLASWVSECTIWRHAAPAHGSDDTSWEKSKSWVNGIVVTELKLVLWILTNMAFLTYSAHCMLTLLNCSARPRLVELSVTSMRKFPASFNWAWHEVHSLISYRVQI